MVKWHNALKVSWQLCLAHTKYLSKSSAYMHAQSHPTLYNPVGYSPPDSSVRRISQARILLLMWVAISCSRGSSWLRDQTCVSCIGRRILYHCATWEAGKNSTKGLNRININHVPPTFPLPIASPVIVFFLLFTSSFLIKMLNQLCLDSSFFLSIFTETSNVGFSFYLCPIHLFLTNLPVELSYNFWLNHLSIFTL